MPFCNLFMQRSLYIDLKSTDG